MKMIKWLSLALIVMAGYQASAQKVFTDGKISYNVKVDLPPGNQQMADMFDGSTYTLYVKGKLSRVDMIFGMRNQTIITNAQDSTMVILMDVMGNKYLIRFSKADIQKQEAKYEGITFTDSSGSKTIAGYQCKQAIAKLEDGTTFPVYYTPDLKQDRNNMANDMFRGLNGFPLEFQQTKQHLKMTFVANNVDLSPVPASMFDVPTSGYREVTPAELYQMLGAGKNGKRR